MASLSLTFSSVCSLAAFNVRFSIIIAIRHVELSIPPLDQSYLTPFHVPVERALDINHFALYHHFLPGSLALCQS